MKAMPDIASKIMSGYMRAAGELIAFLPKRMMQKPPAPRDPIPPMMAANRSVLPSRER
jgi:hypothetical protein